MATGKELDKLTNWGKIVSPQSSMGDTPEGTEELVSFNRGKKFFWYEKMSQV